MSKSDLVGFSDFFTGPAAVQIGVGEPRTRQTPTKAYPPGKTSAAAKNSASTIVKARQTLAKSVQTMGKSLKKLSPNAPVAVQRQYHSTVPLQAQAKKAPVPSKAVAAMKGVKIGEDESIAIFADSLIGAVTKKPMSAKTKAAVDKAKKTLSKFKTAAQQRKKVRSALAQQTVKSNSAIKGLTGSMIKQKRMSKALRGKGKARVGDMLHNPEVVSALGGYYDSIGAEPDPNYPGYLTDGSLDPAYFTAEEIAAFNEAQASGGAPAPSDPETALDPATQQLLDEYDAEEQTDNAFDQGQLGTYNPADFPMHKFYTSAEREALGGIIYDGSLGRPNGFCGSYGLFSRTTDRGVAPDSAGIDGVEHYGYVWGQFWDRGKNQPGGLPFGDDLKTNTWNKVYGRHILAHEKLGTPVGEQEVIAHNSAGTQLLTPVDGIPFGPLVGNPGMPEWARMRVDDKGVMFWLPQEAPEWVLAPLKLAADVTRKKEAEAEAERKKQQQLADAKAKADADAQRAAQQLANDLAEMKAASDAKVTEAAQEGLANQALIEQQQQQTAAATLETQQSQQAGDILMQQAQMQQQMQQMQMEFERQRMQQQMALMQQYPELAYGGYGGYGGGYEDEGYGGYYDEGYGDEGASYEEYGEYADGLDIPGGEVMEYDPYYGQGGGDEEGYY